MTSLVVNCEVNLGFDFFPFILTRHSIDGTDVAPNEPPRAVYFTDGEDIYDRNRRLRFQVSRGKLHRGQETLDVVVKFDFYNNHHADLVKEARLYEKQAKTLQGTALPVFYGIYHATISERPITCLVLEYCGSEMETSLHEVSEEFSFKIAKHLMALHSAGIQNNNISESNIVVKNGEPRLIDLSTATLHTCERTMDIEAGKLRPDALDFACTELHDFASEQGIWEASE
ncbi:hypothetical protein BD410DRAFT_734956 [Rickenella mellea]|uniref:Protein kinase domain-containing protein n=1 Tax=Rickenella mellea TaxID=50990 RepID=A0A4Y7PFU8_9AGAM|nr:hypothetical protein BD410DRAFT_734956 [Rickenella mellea]